MGILDWLLGRTAPVPGKAAPPKAAQTIRVQSSVDPVEWHHRFWADEVGDSEEVLARREGELGLRLPGVLRRFYEGCGLRLSQQVHLEPLERVRVDGPMLVFAHEQQGCFEWALRLEDASHDDPELFANAAGAWSSEVARVSDWLRFFSLCNRPYEAPCGEATPVGSWDSVEVCLDSMGPCTFRISGAAVADASSVGARTRAELRRVTGGEGSADDGNEDDGSEDDPVRYAHRPATSLLTKYLPSPALAQIIGSEPLTRVELTPRLFDYLRRNKLNQGRDIRLDDKLKQVFGDRETITLFDLARAFDHLTPLPAPSTDG